MYTDPKITAQERRLSSRLVHRAPVWIQATVCIQEVSLTINLMTKKGEPVLYEYLIHQWCTFQLLACKFKDRDQCVSTSNTKNTWLSGIYLIFVCQLTVVNLLSPGPVHQTLDNAIPRIDHCPLDKYKRNVSAFSTDWKVTYPVDSIIHLFEQPGAWSAVTIYLHHISHAAIVSNCSYSYYTSPLSAFVYS